MPFIYAFNIRELVTPALSEMQITNPAFYMHRPHDLFRWWLSVALERIFLLECRSDYPTVSIYPYIDFVGLDKMIGDQIIYTQLVKIIRARGYEYFHLTLSHNFDGFLILE